MKNKNMKLRGVRNTNLKKKLGEKCVYCNCENKLALDIDHKIPKSRGGEDNDKNKQITCKICNQIKGSLTHVEFKKYLKALYVMKDLGRLVFIMDSPRVKINATGYPLTEKLILNEIEKESGEKAIESKMKELNDALQKDGE